MFIGSATFANAGNQNLKYLKKLIDNGYYNIAINYAESHINNKKIRLFMYQTLLTRKKFSDILSIYGNETPELFDLVYKCKAYVFLYDFEKADKIIAKIKSVDSKTFGNLYALKQGIMLYKKYEFEKAVKYLNSVTPKSVPLKDIIAKMYILMDKPNLAKNYLTGNKLIKAELNYQLQNYRETLNLLKGLNSNEANILLYNTYIKLNKFSEAEKILNLLENNSDKHFVNNIQILMDYKKFSEAEKILLARDNDYIKFFYLGKIALLKKNYFKAIQYFKSALKKDKNSEVLYLMATCYKKLSAYTEAIKFYLLIVKRADSANINAESLYNIGFCYYKIGDFKNAEKYFKQYLTNEENNLQYIGNCLHLLAESLEKQGKPIDAIKYYNKYLGLLQNNTEIRKIDLKMAQLWESTENYQFAAEIYKKYYPVKSRQDIFILKKLGDIYAKTGHFKESNAFYTEYLNKSGKYIAIIYIKKGLNCLYTNNLESAKKNFLKVIENGKEGKFREEALFWTGKIYYNQKNYKLALLYFQRLLNSNKMSPLSNKALKYICYISYISKNSRNLQIYFNDLQNPFEFVKQFKIPVSSLCKLINCQKEFTIESPDKKNYTYFKKLYAVLNKKNKNQLKEMLNSNRFHGTDNIIYFYIGKIFYSKDLENDAILAFNKFLNNNYNPMFESEYRNALEIVIKYYFSKNNFGKIITFTPVYSKLHLKKDLMFIIGVAGYKYNLTTQSKYYLSNFINRSNNGDKIFRAAFYLDKMNFPDEALKGYLKAEKLLPFNNVKMEMYYWMGEIYLKKEMLEQAVNCYLKIKLMFPFDIKWTPTASFKIAKIFQMKGDFTKALQEYNYVLKKLPDTDPRKSYVESIVKKLKNQ